MVGGGGDGGSARSCAGGGWRRRRGGAPAAACCPVAATPERGVGRRKEVAEDLREEEKWREGDGLVQEARFYSGSGAYGGGRQSGW
jgi:hypothetical protein